QRHGASSDGPAGGRSCPGAEVAGFCGGEGDLLAAGSQQQQPPEDFSWQQQQHFAATVCLAVPTSALTGVSGTAARAGSGMQPAAQGQADNASCGSNRFSATTSLMASENQTALNRPKRMSHAPTRPRDFPYADAGRRVCYSRTVQKICKFLANAER